MSVSTPTDILRECNAALEMLGEAAHGVDFRSHILALLCLQRARLLPPAQQSLSALASNLHNALRAAERTNPLLQGLSADVSFERDPAGHRIEPGVVRSVLSALHTLRCDDQALVARAAEAFVLQHADLRESSFLATLFPALIPLNAGASVLDVGCGSGLRAAVAQRSVTEEQHMSVLPRKIRLRAEDADPFALRLTSLLAVLCDLQLEFQEWGRAFEAHKTARLFDRIFVERRDAPPSFSGILRCMAEHSVAAVLMTDEVVQQLRRADMSLLLERDVLDSVISLHGHLRPTWHIMILRGRKSVERRHRVLFYDHMDAQDGPSLDGLSIESIIEARDQFANNGNHCRVLHRSDILSSSRVLPGMRTTAPLFAYQRDSYPGALSTTQFVELDSQMIQRGLDIHSFFQKSKRNDFFRPTFHDHALVRVAVSSAPTLKNAEIRTHYAFAAWWSAVSPLLLMPETSLPQLREEFVSALSRDSVLSPRQARAVFRDWWTTVEDERSLLSKHSSTAVASGWIEAMLRDAQIKGRRFWFECDATQRTMLEYMCPDTVRSLQASRAALDSIVKTQSEVQISNTQSIADRLMQRRRNTVLDEVQHSQVHVEVAQERIAELREFIQLQKDRMKNLHSRAKAHRTDEQRVEVFDDTREMQDELGLIFARLVPAQSELSLLEKSLQPFILLEHRKEQEQSALDGFVDRLVPELRELRNALSPQLASSLILLQFREQLSRGVEHALMQNREEVIRELEGVWKRLAQGSTFAPQVQGMRVM